METPTPLLNYNEQMLLKEISKKYSESKFNLLAFETEITELREILGIEFLNDLQINRTDSKYVSLLEGGSFTYNDNTLIFKGLKFILAYLIYANYIGKSDVFDTFSGLTTKQHTDSEALSLGRIKNLQEEARRVAMSEVNVMKLYLTVNSTDFPLWNCTISQKQISTPKFSTFKRTRGELDYGSTRITNL